MVDEIISPGKIKRSPIRQSEKKHRNLKRAKYWYDMGQRLMSSGKYAEALAAYSSAINQNREFAEAYFIRGACYYMLGYYRRATDDLNAASLFGCQDAQLWSKFETYRFEEDEEEGDI